MNATEFYDDLESRLSFRDGQITVSSRSSKPPEWSKIALAAMDHDLMLKPDDIRAEMVRRAKERQERTAAPEGEAHATLIHAIDAAVKRVGVLLTPEALLINEATGLAVDRASLVTKILVDVEHCRSQNDLWAIRYGKPRKGKDGSLIYSELGGKELIGATLDEWMDYRSTTEWLALRETLKHDGTDWRPLADKVIELLKVPAGPTERYREACAHALAHWLWQAKRRLFGRSTVWELFLILHGRQGDGKSWWIERLLCGPLKQRFATKGLEIFGDAREFRIWEQLLVVNFDELATNHNGARGFIDHTLLDSMKSVLTSDLMSPRILGVNDQHRFKRLASCIGSTNHSLEHHFSDQSGMRRFFVTEVGFMDRDAVNAFDWSALWRSIDENLDTGYAGEGDGRDLLAEVQRTYKAYSTIEEWADLGDEVPVRNDQSLDGTEFMPMSQAYEAYAKYCRKANVAPKTLRNFGSEIITLPFHKKYVRDNRPPLVAMRLVEDAA